MSRYKNFWSQTFLRDSGCLIWTGSFFRESKARGKRKGLISYGSVWDGSKMRLAHRVAWEKKNGPIPKGKMVLHRCGVKLCVNPEHLYLGNNSDNRVDRVRLCENPRHWITPWQARVLRHLYNKAPKTWLAAIFGVSVQALYQLKYRKFNLKGRL